MQDTASEADGRRSTKGTFCTDVCKENEMKMSCGEKRSIARKHVSGRKRRSLHRTARGSRNTEGIPSTRPLKFLL